ncbi:MAG: purine-nucleoside phosphorylase [Chloroflexi bacterium HGW-Chloroflexi-6]|nr:MAG: purine-nucleoside phosphorylase [Chloroflexi bacterium HGW-Chloroflexi-6]
MNFPILEHEFDGEAKIEPSRVIRPRDVPTACVITFFSEVIEKVIEQTQARVIVPNRWEDGPHPIYEMEHNGQRVAFYHPGVGAPIAAALLEEAIAFGCRNFVAVGGAGVLEKGLEVGKLILVSAAVRDEGTSYHYLPPAREVTANPAAAAAIESVLQRKGLPYHKAKTWTTDAPYRETQAMVAARRTEGCFTVEMEAAALMAVAQFRGVTLGQVLYAGDDLSGDEWDNRGWQSRTEIRESMFWLAVEACLGL